VDLKADQIRGAEELVPGGRFVLVESCECWCGCSGSGRWWLMDRDLSVVVPFHDREAALVHVASLVDR
jgi:hypothetical protein